MALFAKKQDGCRFRIACLKGLVFSSRRWKDSRKHLDSISNISILCICNLKSQKHIVRVIHGRFLTMLK